MGNQSKYAVISDVHANAEAIWAVLRDIKKRRINDIFFIGDAVGYGPDPNECIELLKSECKIMLAGNHDWGVAGLTKTESFNENARIALTWTGRVLNDDNLEILSTSPLEVEIEERNITLVHATPREPEQWHYLQTLSDAEINFKYIQTDICFVGHSHKPFIIGMDVSGEMQIHKREMHRSEGGRYIVNTGSVGQSRDGDPRACYAFVDDARIELIRIGYDIQLTQKKMENALLPRPLIERLSYGF
jgi:predicted phosphodiesterase